MPSIVSAGTGPGGEHMCIRGGPRRLTYAALVSQCGLNCRTMLIVSSLIFLASAANARSFAEVEGGEGGGRGALMRGMGEVGELALNRISCLFPLL